MFYYRFATLTYANQIRYHRRHLTGNRYEKLRDMKRRFSGPKEEEAKLGCLNISGKFGEETYAQLRKEWQVKLRSAENYIVNMEREQKVFLKDLDIALVQISNISSLSPP